MGATVKASQTGLELIDRARRKKDWKKTESAWYGLAKTTESTLKRFWRGMAIQQEVFVAICREVGVEDWQSIADLTPAADQNVAVDVGFIPSTYRQATWVERTELTAKLLEALRSSCRLLVLAGMTGIGKTALAERLIAEMETEDQSDAPGSGRSSRRRFCRLNLDDGGVSADFSLSGAALLRSLGEEPTLADQQDPTNLLNHLLHTLRTQPYRVQIDSLEKLLEGDDLQSNGRAEREGWSEFCDPLWLDLWQQFLAGGDCQSQVILTTQEVPAGLEAIGSRYPQFWNCELLRGLNEAEQLELFGKAGLFVDRLPEQPPNPPILGGFRTKVSDDPSISRDFPTDQSPPELGDLGGVYRNQSPQNATPDEQSKKVDLEGIDYLKRIGKLYAGHPLVLRVIAEDIKENCGGNIKRYWQQGGFEQLEANRPAKFSRRRLQLEVKQRVSDSLAKLSDDALQLLCRASVYRRPVPAAFWFALLPERTESQHQAALNLLQSRSFAEEDWESEAWLGSEASIPLRQHNLIRAVAYERLKADRTRWETAERQAAEIWLTAYEPNPDAPNLEKVRGNLEAFDHYCELEDWQAAKAILLEQSLGSKLQTWGYYKEMIKVHWRLLSHLSDQDQVACTKGLGNAYYLLSQYPQAINYYQQSLELACEINDLQGQWKALNNLGIIYRILGNYSKSIETHQQTLIIAREIGDRQGEGAALGNLGIAYNNLDNYQEAIDYHQQRLTIAREIGDRQGESNALGNLGNAYNNLGNYQQAIDYHQQNLTIAREIGDRQGEGSALGNLGTAYFSLGNYYQAIDYHQQALSISREIGDRRGQGQDLGNLGITYEKLKAYIQATDYAQQHLNLSREIGDRRGEGAGLRELGVALLRLEEYAEASNNLQAALTIFAEVQSRSDEAVTLKNLAELHQKTGELDRALDYCDRALALAIELGIPLVKECEKLKTELEQSSTDIGEEEM